MKSIYASPMRVYLVLGLLALVGVYCGTKLPISLFPNSSKPRVVYGIPYGNLTSDEFLNTFGRDLESKIANINTGPVKVAKLESHYGPSQVRYEVEFDWGTPPMAAENELNNAVLSFAARFSEESRDGMWHWLDVENAGFFAASFFSAQRDLNSLYDIIDPAFRGKISKIEDAEEAVIYNPSRNEIRVELNPDAMASLQLFPRDIHTALSRVLASHQGGSVQMGTSRLQVQMPRSVMKLEDLNQVPIPTPSGQTVHLSDISRVDYAPSSVWNRSFKTNGAESLILFGTPVSGGNIKRMSEEFLRVIDEVAPTLPKDVEYRILVDPSEFIRSSVRNVMHEVLLAALIATTILFIFIGSARNVLTAAIEIPLSMVLAFILMRMFNMNLNLISLGGLALSAGMNVDASVVVMENIFRHFKNAPGPHTFQSKLNIITEAVKEVRLPVIAATIASLVVFIPLAFTSDLTNAILGDLAKAVVFSHGFSAIVALILVPTIRLQLMKNEVEKKKTSKIQSAIKKMEDLYASALSAFLNRNLLRRAVYFGLVGGLVALLAFVLPQLPTEIVGKPDTDWLILNMRTKGNTKNTQMDSQAREIEKKFLDKFGSEIKYTFSRVSGPNRARIMARLKDKRKMNELWKKMEAEYTNTPLTRFRVFPWNPSELEIPDPPHMKVSFRGGDFDDQVAVARAINDQFHEEKVFDRIYSDPNIGRSRAIVLKPHLEQWSQLNEQGSRISHSDLSDLVRVATSGRRIGYLPEKDDRTPIFLRYPMDIIDTPEKVQSLPVGVDSKIIPLKALATVDVEEVRPNLYREDEQNLILLKGRTDKGEEHKKAASIAHAKKIVERWKKENAGTFTSSIIFEDPEIELTEALTQLTTAVSLSVVLIFLTLLLQFGSVMSVLLVLVAIPLGLIGVLGALYLFNSTLSLNSVLGVILLNGIAVANSILLVDFIRRLVAKGMSAKEAAIEAGRKRLRPILITSLTTVLGMLPIALGLGDGGRILQPLGITVSAGLWVSTMLTLFLVPALQVGYLEWNSSEKGMGWLAKLFRWKVSLPKPRTADGMAAQGLTLSIVIILLGASVLAFGEEKPKESNLLKFDEALAKIVERSPSVAASEANLDATRAKNVEIDLIYLPSVSLVGNYETGEQVLGSERTTTGSVTASGRLNLFKFGADRAAQNRASAEEGEREFELQDNILSAEFEAARGLLSYISALKTEDIRRRSVEIRTAALKIANQRYRKGLLAKQEVDKVTIERDNALATLRDAQANVIAAKATLVALLGHANVEVEWPWQKRLSKSTVANADSSALSVRPDWQAAKKSVDASYHRSKESFGNIFPSLDLDGSYGYFNNLSTNTDGYLWSAGVTLSIPLFDRLANVSEYRERVYRKAAAEHRLEQTRRDAKMEWESAKGAFKIALETASVRDKTKKLSEKLYQTNLRRFRRGLVDVNNLILDQDRLFNSELLAVSGWQNAHLRFSEMCKAYGRRIAECLSNQ